MTRTPTQAAAAYFDSWRAGDAAALRELLADDVSFVGPLGQADNAEDCLRGLTGLAGLTTGIEVLRVFQDGDDVLTWFELRTSVADPVPVANWSRVVDGRITRIRVAFDARGLAAALGR